MVGTLVAELPLGALSCLEGLVVRTGARCSGPVQRPDALGGERGEGYSCGPREITVASGYRPASRSQAQGRPGPDEGVFGVRWAVDEVPRLERSFLALDQEHALAGENQEVLLVRFAVIPATRLPDVLLLSLDLADGRVLPVPEPARRMARSSILSGNLQKGAV